MPKHDKPEPLLVESFSDIALLSQVLPGKPFHNLVGQSIRMKVKSK